MVHFQSKKLGCNWSEMGTETNSSLDTIIEQKILNFY